MIEMTKIVKLGRSQSSTDLVVLVLRKVSKSSFAYWIVAKPKPKYYVPSNFRMFEGYNSNPVEHIFFQFQQKMDLENKNEAML